MGCGKSSVGRLVASRLGCAFTDLDEAVEAAQGRSVGRIFAEDGEAGFRAAEVAALRDVIQGEAPVIPSEVEESEISPRASLGRNDNVHVLALGGGTLTTPEAKKLVAEKARCIYLRASVDTLVENLTMTGTASRPLLEGADDEASLRSCVETLMAKRSATYEEAADVIIDIDGLSTEQIAYKAITTSRRLQ